MKLFKIGKYIRTKTIIWHMVVEMLKNRARFCLSCNYFCTLYFLLKIKEGKLKNLHTSACVKLNYGTRKQKGKT